MDALLPTPVADLATAVQFFKLLWPDGSPLPSELRTFGNEAGVACFDNPADAAASLGDTTRPWFMLGLVRPGARGRGRAEDVLAIPCLWMDVDTLVGSHKKTELPSHADGLAFIRQLPLRPSLILDSGGGYYALWLLREPWVLATRAEREAAAALSTAWQALVHALGQQRGWDFDRTAALSQLLRAAGALNTKYSPPRLVRFVEVNDARYNQSDFEEIIELFGTLEPERSLRAGPIELPVELAPSLKRAVEGLGRGARSKRDADGRLVAIVLNVCPICAGRSKDGRTIDVGTAHIAPLSGRLRCKRQSCEAREGGPSRGIQFGEWTKRVLAPEIADEVLSLRAAELNAYRASQDPAPPAADTPVLELAALDDGALRESIESAEREARDLHGIVDVAVPPGVGKTRAVLDLLAERGRGVLFAPSHQLLDEHEASLRERGIDPVRVVGIPTACLFQDAFRAYGRPRDWRATACRGCPHRTDGTCKAWTWQSRIGHGIALAATDSLPSLLDHHPAKGEPSLLADSVIFIDERWNPTEALAVTREQLRAPLDHPPTSSKLGEPLGELCGKLDVLCGRALAQHQSDPQTPDYETQHELAGLLAEATRSAELDQLRELATRVVAASDTHWPRYSAADLRSGSLGLARYYHPSLRDLCGALRNYRGESKGEATAGDAVRVRIEFTVLGKVVGLRLTRVRPIPIEKCAGIVILDATGEHEVEALRAAHPDVPVLLRGLRVAPTPSARIVRARIVSTNVAKRSLLNAGGVTTRGWGLLRNVLRVVGRLSSEHQLADPLTLALITHKAVAQALRADPERLVRLLPPGVVIRSEHIGYYGRDDRGSNRFKDADALVTFGDPFPNVGATRSTARLLRISEERASLRHVVATLLQAHGRLRSLRASGPKLHVHVGSCMPDPGDPWPTQLLPRGKPAGPAHDQVEAIVEELLGARCPVSALVVEKVLAGCVVYPAPREAIAILREIEGDALAPCSVRSTRLWLAEMALDLGALEDLARVPHGDVSYWRMPPTRADECAAQLARAHEAFRDRPSALKRAAGEPPHAEVDATADGELPLATARLIAEWRDRIEALERERGISRELAALRLHAQETARWIAAPDAGASA